MFSVVGRLAIGFDGWLISALTSAPSPELYNRAKPIENRRDVPLRPGGGVRRRAKVTSEIVCAPLYPRREPVPSHSLAMKRFMTEKCGLAIRGQTRL